MHGRLVVCPTPIGNLEDVTLRVLRVLGEADVVACEDTRRIRKLLTHHGVRARLVSYHEHNELRRAAELVRRIDGGEVVALVSDAGMPVLSDPGLVLVRSCMDAGLPVEVLPGPSAIPTAVAASGIDAESWCFVGYLPRRKGDLVRLVSDAQMALVAFESPKRVAQSVARIAEVESERPVAIMRELTKVHEEILRGTAGELATELSGRERILGEVTLVIGAPPPPAGRAEPGAALIGAVDDLVEAGAKPRRAAAVVARLAARSGRVVGANAVYKAWAERD